MHTPGARKMQIGLQQLLESLQCDFVLHFEYADPYAVIPGVDLKIQRAS
jgi:hypothetical protein